MGTTWIVTESLSVSSRLKLRGNVSTSKQVLITTIWGRDKSYGKILVRVAQKTQTLQDPLPSGAFSIWEPAQDGPTLIIGNRVLRSASDPHSLSGCIFVYNRGYTPSTRTPRKQKSYSVCIALLQIYSQVRCSSLKGALAATTACEHFHVHFLRLTLQLRTFFVLCFSRFGK